MGRVLAMYDVRGIQGYIFRTPRIKEAIGASAIVEDIIEKALDHAVKAEMEIQPELRVCLKWKDGNKILPFEESGDIQTLFIGGGNATVMYADEKLCRSVNCRMAKYILEKTYSLQLACAFVGKTDNYADDYKRLQNKLTEIKAGMPDSKPLGALPVMKAEIRTGFPATKTSDGIDISKETLIKRSVSADREDIRRAEKILDNYVTKKGEDSLLAVVHIDGNNMGLRIRSLIEGIEDYKTAVEKMRSISNNIDSSYKKVFDKMADFFNENSAGADMLYEAGKADYFLRKIITAGDDITYVCNANIAMATVEYFAKEIAHYSMTGMTDEDSLLKYGFSVCGGIAYCGAHFPFSIAYDVAESCCDSAKTRAKEKRNTCVYDRFERIGNYVDFQFCKNIQARDVDSVREKEYRTHTREELLSRPYHIITDCDGELAKTDDAYSYETFKRYMIHFRDDRNIPRSFAKELRNTYPKGRKEVELLASFLRSRQHKLPDGDYEMYDGNRAKYYDALELFDHYIPLEELQNESEAE